MKANGAATPAEQECLFETPGLHVVEMRAGEAGHAIPLVFDDGSRTEQAQIRQVIDKEAEQIYLRLVTKFISTSNIRRMIISSNGMFPTGSVTGISSVLPTSGAVSE